MSRSILRASLPDALLTGSQELLRRHAILWHEVAGVATIVDILPAEALTGEVSCQAFPGELWTAAPVLAHAHLESWDAPSATWPRASFSAWVEALLAWRAGPRLSPAASAAHSLSALAEAGTALVASHVSEAGALPGAEAEAAAVPPMNASSWPQVLAWQECLGAAAAAQAEAPLRWPECDGLAIHAPYSLPLEQAQGLFCRRTDPPRSIHLGEHEEERELLVAGTGPMAAFLEARGLALPRQRFLGPVDWLAQAGGLRQGLLAVHGGNLTTAELQQLATAGVQLVFCPGTHRYFDRPRPAFLEAGIPLPVLGCDSMASNTVLDPLWELQEVCRLFPEVGAAAWWQRLTRAGAMALGRADLGQIAVGASLRVMRLALPPQEALASAAACCEYLASGAPERVGGSAWPPC